MFTPQQYRAKADQYQELGKQTAVANEIREFQALERSFATLADNEEWLQINSDKTVQGAAADRPADPALPRSCRDPAMEHHSEKASARAVRQRGLDGQPAADQRAQGAARAVFASAQGLDQP